MAYRSFAHFLDELDRISELVRIAEPVATEFEITELADRQMKSPRGGKALLFENRRSTGSLRNFRWQSTPWDPNDEWRARSGWNQSTS